ncbi:hypothetical protein LHA31_10365 [Carnobacterium viridans]|uniref:Uncharacterized protein n=1 Tax=Carnobacterium viridans TaxID=174587 RepID=A0A1H0YTT4_9LACT|nr:hypothetical protein [Carnobacterium viridans]UDE94948.1 hypothetical protein LHA31_10365 [Carnobacterium viridans]SDQ18589.1 hypothetical protein SAMN04487752_1152 [Carnobacterium viridans]
MANVYQIPHKYDMSRYHQVDTKSPVKTAFQIGSNSELKVVSLHENGLVTFSDEKQREFWSSRPLTDNGDRTLSFNG